MFFLVILKCKYIFSFPFFVVLVFVYMAFTTPCKNINVLFSKLIRKEILIFSKFHRWNDDFSWIFHSLLFSNFLLIISFFLLKFYWLSHSFIFLSWAQLYALIGGLQFFAFSSNQLEKTLRPIQTPYGVAASRRTIPSWPSLQIRRRKLGMSFPSATFDIWLNNFVLNSLSRRITIHLSRRSTVDQVDIKTVEKTTNSLLFELKPHILCPISVAASPSSNIVATSSFDGNIRIFDMTDGM